MRHVISILGICFMANVLPVDGTPLASATAHAQEKPPAKTVLVIHGGAGVLNEQEMKAAGVTRKDYEDALAQSLRAGYLAMQDKNKTSVDAVEAAVRVMEDSELFNAGRGAVFNSDGRIELDASIMEGKMEGKGEGKRDPRKRAGAIASVAHVKNPISAARAVMEMDGGRHVMLFGAGAEDYVLSDKIRAKYGIERVSNIYFWTDRHLRNIQEVYKKSNAVTGRTAAVPLPADRRFGTVGAVAVDSRQNIAAGTSTGGITGKLPGRIGDSPVIGAGTYADDRACGVSCTGTGELFIRHAVAHDVAARMLYGKNPLADAVAATIAGLPDEPGGVGGLIALDRNGNHSFGMTKNTEGIYRGWVTESGQIYVALFANETGKLMPK